MLALPTIDALREALAPVEALRGEHALFETWMRESLAAIDALHDELAQWQRGLTRQQAALDQREAAVAAEQIAAEAVAELELREAEARQEIRQLERQRDDQLLAIEALERQLAVVSAELRHANKRTDELTDALSAERQRAVEEHRQWAAELREMRKTMELAVVARTPAAAWTADQHSGGDELAGEGDGADSQPEQRRQALSRRATPPQKQ